ncbi:hypothetical protein Purlil1_12115 [Purpureocillium lilacinum]|uniref:Uncharacterized protein n=1 Tax=Purpureocillium lilacinum TaxID=33203 RepID=A0ABR0BHT3_PURLI|nr:hypothetical protein Purlil1_12115 [Purpureocillium lilacinum]
MEVSNTGRGLADGEGACNLLATRHGFAPVTIPNDVLRTTETRRPTRSLTIGPRRSLNPHQAACLDHPGEASSSHDGEAITPTRKLHRKATTVFETGLHHVLPGTQRSHAFFTGWCARSVKLPMPSVGITSRVASAVTGAISICAPAKRNDWKGCCRPGAALAARRAIARAGTSRYPGSWRGDGVDTVSAAMQDLLRLGGHGPCAAWIPVYQRIEVIREPVNHRWCCMSRYACARASFSPQATLRASLFVDRANSNPHFLPLLMCSDVASCRGASTLESSSRVNG